MKILLCSQYLGDSKPVATPKIAFPLGLAYIASMISDNDIVVFDPNIVTNPLQKLRKTIENFNPDLVALSLRNIDGQLSFNISSYYEPFVSMIKIIKESAPFSKLIVGGPGFTVFAEEIMKRNPEITFGIVSNGELAIVDLLKNLQHPERVKNLFFRDNGQLHFTGLGPSPQLDSLPAPFLEAFDMSKYKQFPYSMGIESKRGCAFNCVYCLYSCLQGSHVLLKSPKKAVDEIERLRDDYGIEHFFFVDPIFNFPREHGRKICQEIMRRNLDIKWRAWFRSDYMNERFMVDALNAGCDIFDFSPDGACNEALAVLGKNMDISDVNRTIDTIGKIENVKVGYNFMYDLPRANLQQMVGLTRVTSKIVRTCGNKLQYLALTRIRIYPHTSIYNTALMEGKITKQTDLIPPVYYTSNSSKIQRCYASILDKLILNRALNVT